MVHPYLRLNVSSTPDVISQREREGQDPPLQIEVAPRQREAVRGSWRLEFRECWIVMTIKRLPFPRELSAKLTEGSKAPSDEGAVEPYGTPKKPAFRGEEESPHEYECCHTWQHLTSTANDDETEGESLGTERSIKNDFCITLTTMLWYSIQYISVSTLCDHFILEVNK